MSYYNIIIKKTMFKQLKIVIPFCRTKLEFSQLFERAKKDIQHPSRKYQLHYQIKDQFLGLLREFNARENSHDELCRLFEMVSGYPKFVMKEEDFTKLYGIMGDGMHQRSCRQMNQALLFVLKTHNQAEESMIFLQFLRFWLAHRGQYIKAKFQINFRDLTLGEFLKRLSAKVVQRSFLPRTPPYTRQLTILHPVITLQYLLKNPSTSSSLMIKKLHYFIFLGIQEKYQSMRQNLYHSQNTDLWGKLNALVEGVFIELPMIEHENEYLRQLYMLLMLAMLQQGKEKEVIGQVKKIMLAYDFVVKRMEQKGIVKEWVEGVGLLVEGMNFGEVWKDGLHESFFLVHKHFPQTAPRCIETLSQLYIPPIILHFYFQSFIAMSTIPLTLEAAITQNKEYLQHLTLEQLNKLLPLLSTSECRHALVTAVLNRHYDSLSAQDIVELLGIYVEVSQLSVSQPLRVFLFRYIADHHQHFPLPCFQAILTHLLLLNDYELFNDEQNHYPDNIYHQLSPHIQTIKHQLPQQLLSKLPHI